MLGVMTMGYTNQVGGINEGNDLKIWISEINHL